MFKERYDLSSLPPEKNVTWLCWNLQNIKLSLVFRAGHTSFYGKQHSPINDQVIWDDSQTIEIYAKVMGTSIDRADDRERGFHYPHFWGNPRWVLKGHEIHYSRQANLHIYVLD